MENNSKNMWISFCHFNLLQFSLNPLFITIFIFLTLLFVFYPHYPHYPQSLKGPCLQGFSQILPFLFKIIYVILSLTKMMGQGEPK